MSEGRGLRSSWVLRLGSEGSFLQGEALRRAAKGTSGVWRRLGPRVDLEAG